MGGVEFREVECKSALNRVVGMPFAWSLNPYRGCAHDCHYCYARATHEFLELDGDTQFARVILVKANLPEMLEGELVRRRRSQDARVRRGARAEVAIGTATDPYQPVEGRWRLTRRSLELFARYRTPVSLVTKGTMVVRDVDVLQEVGCRAGATVCFSVPTVDVDTWRRAEPGTAPPAQRLRAMRRLVDAGVEAGVVMAPLLPGLSANADAIERTVRAAAEHGARFIGSGLLHLDAGVRAHYLGFLGREYPELLAGYERLYGGGGRREAKYAPREYSARVERRVCAAKAAVGYLEAEQHRQVVPPRVDRQLELPLLAAG